MEKRKLYSYIKNPFCKNGWPSFGLSMTAFVLTQAVCFFSVKNAGGIGMCTAAVAVSSMLIDLTSFIFISMSFKEKNKNYIFAVISLIVAIFILIEWVCIFSK